jgi:hypothetical protein
MRNCHASFVSDILPSEAEHNDFEDDLAFDDDPEDEHIHILAPL